MMFALFSKKNMKKWTTSVDYKTLSELAVK